MKEGRGIGNIDMSSSTRVRVRAKAGAKRERIEKVEDLVFRVEVRARAERGEANAVIKKLLAQALRCKPDDLHLVTGARSPSKTYALITK